MEQKVLQDLFNRAVSQGYPKTIEDFSVLIGSNRDVLQDNYNYIKSQGYQKTIEDFEALVGVKKKDEPVLDSDSEDGSLDSSSTDSQPEVLKKDLTFPEPQKEIPTEVAPEIPEVLIETKVDISPKEIEDQRKFLEEQGIDVDAALRRRKFGDVPSIGTEEEDVSSIYSTYLTDKSSRNIITDLSSGLSKPAQRELDDEVELKPTEIDQNILKSLKINEEDYSKWEQNTQREELASFKFIKEAIATDEGEEFADEKKNIERLASYKNEIIGNLQEDIKTINSKLQLALDPKDKLELLNIKKQLEGRLTEESTLLSGIADLFPKFTELTSKLDLDRRKRVYVAGQIGGNIQLFTEAGEIAKTIPTTITSFALGTAASLTSLLDQTAAAAGADKKGVLAGITESLLDTSESMMQEVGPVQRTGFIEGKNVVFEGKDYVVTDDGDVIDPITNVSLYGILPEDKLKKIQDRSKNVKFTEVSWAGGALAQTGVQTMVNLFALIRGGKRLSSKLPISPGVGMGLASYASTSAQSVEDMRADLVRSGLTENEALLIAAGAGNAIATLDGFFSGLAGSNTKILSSVQGIKKGIVDFVKKEGKTFSKDKFNRKIKDLVNENLKEVAIEELPVLFSEKGINAVVNSITDLNVRSSALKSSEIIETVVLTIGATSSLGSKNLLSGNKRADAVRYVARNVDNLEGTIDNLVSEKQLTPEEGKLAYEEIYAMQTAENRTKGTIVESDNMVEMSDLLNQRQRLKEQREGLEGPLKEEQDQKIADIDEQIKIVKDRDTQQVKSEEQKEDQPEETIQESPVSEEERLRDNQVVKEAEVFEVDMQSPDGTNTTVEVKTNLDGSREVSMIIDGARSREMVSKDNTLSNKDYVERAYGEIVSSESKPITEIMSQKKIDRLSSRQKKAVGLETKPSIKEPFILRGPKGGVTSTQINFNEEGQIESVVNKKTGKPVSDKARKRAEKEYLESIIDVNEGQRSEIKSEGITPGQLNQEIADTSNNPKEIAEAIVNEEQLIKEESSEKRTLFDDDKLNPLIGVKFTPESWIEVTGVDPSDFGLTSAWISKDGVSLKDGWVDFVGEENVTLEEVVEFMKNNPNAEALNVLAGKKGVDKNTLTSLKEKFKELTGVEATPTNINTVINIDPNREPLSVAKEQADVQAQKEATEPGVFGKKKGPDPDKITKDKPKKVTVDESKALRDQIKLEAKAAKESVSAYRKAATSVIDYIKKLKSTGTLSSFKAKTLISRALRTNLLSEKQVDGLIDYVTQVLESASIANRLRAAKAKQKKVKSNIKSKIGDQNNALKDALQQLANIDVALIPLDKLDSFEELMNRYGASKKVLEIEDVGADTKLAEDIINSINFEVENEIEEAGEQTKIPEEYNVEEAISEIKETEVDLNKIESKESRDIAEDITNLSEEDIKGLIKEKKGEPDYSTIETLRAVVGNLKAGVVTAAAVEILTEVDSNKNSKLALNPINKVSFKGVMQNFKNLSSKIKIALNKKTPSGTNLILDKIRSSPTVFIDNALGNFNSTVVYDNTFGIIAKAYEQFKVATDRGFAKINLAEKALEYDGLGAARKLSRTGKSINKIVAKKYKIRLLQIAREHDLNMIDGKTNPKAPSAKSFIDLTIDYLDKEGLNNDRDILKKLREEFTVDGEISLSKLEKSLTSGEKKALKIYDEVNNSLAEKAKFASSVIRSNRIDLLNGYSHRVVLSGDRGSEQIELDNKINNFINPSTKSGTFLERTKGAKPIDFDPSTSAQRGLQETNLDYYMTLPVRTVNKTINKVEKGVDSENKDAVKAASALKKSMNEVLKVTFGETMKSVSTASKLVGDIEKFAYQAILASVTRMGAEFISNITMALSNPKAAAIGFKRFKNLSLSGGKLGLDILINLGSSEGSKLFDPKKMSSRFVDLNDYTQVSPKSKSAKSSLQNAIGVIMNLGPKQSAEAIDAINSRMMSTPDQAVSRPMWFGTFAYEFEKQTGIALTDADMRAIADGTSKYLSKEYKDSIKKAVDLADKSSVRVSTTRNPFKGVIKNMKRSGSSASMNLYRTINSFMANFSLFEYATARDAVGALQKKGDISKSQAIGILTGVGARMTMYPIIYKILNENFDQFFAQSLGFAIDDDDEDEDIEDVISRQAIGTALTLLTRKSMGNIPNLLPAYAIEEFNKEYLGSLRKGEYDRFTDAIVFAPLTEESLKEEGLIKGAAQVALGPLNPIAKTLERAQKVYTKSETLKEKEGRDRNLKELKERIPLEVLGNIGLIPFYKDVRRIYLKKLFAGIDKKKSGKFTNKDLKELGVDIDFAKEELDEINRILKDAMSQ